jgi:hypothetical protein
MVFVNNSVDSRGGEDAHPYYTRVMSNKLNLLFAIILVVLLVAAGVYMSKHKKAPSVDPLSAPVADIDITSGSESVLEGLPKDLPINSQNIVEQKRLNYPGQNAILYSLSYRTSRSADDVVADYVSYFSSHDYRLRTASSTAATSTNMSIAAEKSNGSMTVAVSPREGFNLVNVAVLYTK